MLQSGRGRRSNALFMFTGKWELSSFIHGQGLVRRDTIEPFYISLALVSIRTHFTGGKFISKLPGRIIGLDHRTPH